jgi:DNA-binding NtrC family response regulator
MGYAGEQGVPPQQPVASHAPAAGPAAAPPAPMPEPDDDEEVVDEDVPLASAAPPSQDGRRLADVAREAALAAERIVISDTLRQVHWNRRKAAQILGVSYKTLLNKIKETGIERP